MKREATINRNTSETKIKLNINLDGNGVSDINTGIGFFDHMLELMSFHSGIDLTYKLWEICTYVITILLKMLG